MNKSKFDKISGFTLIELLMVILVVGILASIGISQFVNFGKDARDAATKSNLQVLRRAIASQNGMMRLRCGVVSDAYPPLATLTANDITSAAPCSSYSAAFTDADKAFVANGIPNNPWSGVNTIAACATGDTPAASGGWCYEVATGKIWANSKLNNGDSTGDEADF